MNNRKNIIKKRFLFWIMSVVVCTVFVINYSSSNLLPRFLKYAEYQCTNIVSKIINYVMVEQKVEDFENRVVVYGDDQQSIVALNVDALNSIAFNVINRSQVIMQDFENGFLDSELSHNLGINVSADLNRKGIVYEIPIGMILGDSIIGNFGIKVPVKFNIIGEISGQITSSIENYGINNSLLEIDLEIYAKSSILIPMMTQEQKVNLSIPLVVKIIQGKVPDYYVGTHVVGGVN